jgi:hypothetical protein
MLESLLQALQVALRRCPEVVRAALHLEFSQEAITNASEASTENCDLGGLSPLEALCASCIACGFHREALALIEEKVKSLGPTDGDVALYNAAWDALSSLLRPAGSPAAPHCTVEVKPLKGRCLVAAGNGFAGGDLVLAALPYAKVTTAKHAASAASDPSSSSTGYSSLILECLEAAKRTPAELAVFRETVLTLSTGTEMVQEPAGLKKGMVSQPLVDLVRSVDPDAQVHSWDHGKTFNSFSSTFNFFFLFFFSCSLSYPHSP